MNFVKKSYVFVLISSFLVLFSLIFISVKGINIGIDFSGGGVVYFKGYLTNDNIWEIKKSISQKVNSVSIERNGSDGNFILKFTETKEVNLANGMEIIKGFINKYDGIEIEKTDLIGSQFGRDIIYNSCLAIFFALVTIFLYVLFKFGARLATGATIALIHDCIFALGICAILGIELNLMIVSAVLTIIGYSINDTVVVYDRIRQYYKDAINAKKPINQEIFVNSAIKAVLKRSLITSMVTIIAIISLVFVDESNIKEFAIVIISGILAGTFSSISVAAIIANICDIGLKIKSKNQNTDPMKYV